MRRYRGTLLVKVTITCLTCYVMVAHARDLPSVSSAPRLEARGEDHKAGTPPARAAASTSDTQTGAVVHRRRSRPFTPEQLTRRLPRIAQLRQYMGNEFMQRGDVMTEYNVHAWRIARLRRARTLAAEQNNIDIVGKTDTLIKKELERHKRRLEQLREVHPRTDAGGLPGVSPRQPDTAGLRGEGQP